MRRGRGGLFLLAVLVIQQVFAEEAELLDLDAASPNLEASIGGAKAAEEVTATQCDANPEKLAAVPPPKEEVAAAAVSSEATAASSEAGPVPSEPAAVPKEGVVKESGSLVNETIKQPPLQSGPFIDLFGPTLLKLAMVDERHAQLQPMLTNEALQGKKVVGLYFSADWCGPCRQFTPELNSFYDKINARRGRKNEFEIVWISRCRDTNSYGQYFTKMAGWLALPPEEAMGQRGQWLGTKYKVKGIPSLVLLDDLGHVITLDGRNKVPKDKAGVGFPWRNPIATLYMTLVPRTLRLMIQSQIFDVKDRVVSLLQRIIHPKRAAPA